MDTLAAEIQSIKGIDVAIGKNTLTFRWPWLSWDSFLLLIMFTVVWNGVIFSMFAALLIDRIQKGDASSAFWFLLLPHFWGGLILIYHVFAMYLNNRVGRHRRIWKGNYDLYALTIKEEHTKLLTGLESAEHALLVRQMIEEYLGIEENVLVQGEYGR